MPKEVIWTPELVSKLWSTISNSRLSELSFSKLVGSKLLQLISNEIEHQDSILDFGAGDGDLAKLLINAGHNVDTYDFSEVRNKKGNLISSTKSIQKKYDTIFMVEVIEHILEEDLNITFQKLYDFMHEKSTLIITTPNNEDLELSECFCPICDSRFHRWQHVRSFTEKSLTDLLNKFNIGVKVIHKVDFSSYGDLHTEHQELVDEIFRLKKEIKFLKKNLLKRIYIRYIKKKPLYDMPLKSISPQITSGAQNQLVCIAYKN